MESFNRAKTTVPQIDPTLIRDLIAAIDQKNITVVDKLVADSGIFPSYEAFWHTLRKIPNDELRDRYLRELRSLLTTLPMQPKLPLLTAAEKTYIESRKLWSDVVSATDQLNESYKLRVDIKKKLYERLERLGYKNPADLVKKAIDHLQNRTAVVITFNASMLYSGLKDFQLLNMFERGIRHNAPISDDYRNSRNSTEDGLFSRLDSDTKAALQQNAFAKPRYGALAFLDNKSGVAPSVDYGKSFVVLKHAVKLNSLFLAKDSFYHSQSYYGDNSGSSSLTPATFHHLEILLFECGDKKLKAIMDWVINGSVPSGYSHQNFQPRVPNIEEFSYIEVLLPAVNMLDVNLVEQVHIDNEEYEHKTEINLNHYYSDYQRFHLFPAVYNDKKGDAAKAEILGEYKDELNKITNVFQLNEFTERLDSDQRYKILCQGQGLTTRFFNLFCHVKKTFSERALEMMIEYKRRSIEALPLIGLKQE